MLEFHDNTQIIETISMAQKTVKEEGICFFLNMFYNGFLGRVGCIWLGRDSLKEKELQARTGSPPDVQKPAAVGQNKVASKNKKALDGCISSRIIG